MEDHPEPGFVVDRGQLHQPSLPVEAQGQPDLSASLAVDDWCRNNGVAPDFQDILPVDVGMRTMNPGMDHGLKFHGLLPDGVLAGFIGGTWPCGM